MLIITEEELRALHQLYAKAKLAILKNVGIEVEGGWVEIYDVYLKNDADVGIALYYNSKIYDWGEKPLTKYTTFTDARIDSQRFGFFKSSGKALQYEVEEQPGGKYALHVHLDEPVAKGSRLNIYAKGHTSGEIWMEALHHKMWLKKGEPVVFDGMRHVWKPKNFHATLWKMPKGCILFEAFPQPWEIYVENGRLNILFVFYKPSPCKMYMKFLNP